MIKLTRKGTLRLIMITMLSAALACNMPSREVATAPTRIPPEGQIQVTQPSGDSPADDVQPPVIEKTSTPDSPMPEAGLSRANPFPIDNEVVTPYWDIKVLEFHRGEAAWQIIQVDDPEASPPPPGKEYALVKVLLRNKNPDANAQNFGLSELFITGDALQVHGDVLIDQPTPELVFSDIYTAEILEGWLDVLVDPEEGNLMLVFDREDYINDERQSREVRYIALEGAASIEVPSELDEITPNDLGLESGNPAKIGETVIGEDWEVTVLETVSGEAAWNIVMQMNDKSDPPDEGMEYIAFRDHIRRISSQDMTDYRPNFWTYVKDEETGSWETIAEPHIRNKHPELFPIMDFYFFPGLESEGWFVLLGPVSQNSQLATVDVGGDFATSSRYFQLNP